MLYNIYTTKYNLCRPYSCGCGLIHWTVVELPGATLLKETESLSLRCHQCSGAPQLGVGTWEPLPLHVGMLPSLTFLFGPYR